MIFLYPVRVGELSFANTIPFRLTGKWFPMPCPSPRLLAQWAKDDRIDAGPIPVAEGWGLADFEPLGPYGIAVKRQAGSVLLFSKRPWGELNKTPIGITDQTATSVRLLETLFRVRDGLAPILREGFNPSDEARLLIGDNALIPPAEVTDHFSHVYDLGEEWHRWQGLPFVFARWMVRKNIPTYLRNRLQESLETALAGFAENRENLCRQSARFLKLPTLRLCSYIRGFTYRLTSAEERSEALFKELSAKREKTRA
jgi:chorismate dehydratase